ncbi:MAG: hypothetical protein ILP10_00730 [Lachnospiraceae bacterium]|nr:hypothetical protein [Lachnospiraceae bacterium]
MKETQIRRNCFDIAVRSLLLGTSVVITAVLVSIGVMQLGRAKSLAGAVGSQISDIEQRVSESDVMAFDGARVNGSDVVNFCARYLDGVSEPGDAPFVVKIKSAGEVCSGSTKSFVQKLKDEEGPDYIIPYKVFSCKVVKNENKVITEVVFERR